MRALFLLLIVSISMNVLANEKHGKGKVERISAYISGGERYRTIDIQNLNNDGVNCYQSGATNLITILIESTEFGDSQYSLAMAAFIADQKVRVKVDDNQKIGNYCVLQLIQICKNDTSCS